MPKPCTQRRPVAAFFAAVLTVCSAGLLTLAAPPASASIAGAASVAAANVGKSAGYCAVRATKNSNGGKQFATSCDGHLGTGQGEYWCADFGRWVWNKAGLVTDGLTAAAASFDTYGSTYSSYRTTLSPGDAITFAYSKGDTAHHVGIVTSVGGGTVTVANGDWDGTSGNGESTFARTSKVVSISFSTSLASRGTYVPAYQMYVSRIVGPVENA